MALAAAVLVFCGAPAVGWVTGSLTDESLRESVRIQRQQRVETIATVVRHAPGPESGAYDSESTSTQGKRLRVVANWTAADGSRHTGTVSTVLQSARAGDSFTLWTDRAGRIVNRPLDEATAHVHAVLAGFGAALMSAWLIECGRRLAVWHLVRRRYSDLDRAWAKAGPDWGRTGAGS